MPSSVIRSFNYRADARELDILFVTDRRYVYQNVPSEVADALNSAGSKGEYFNRHIRDVYGFTRVR